MISNIFIDRPIFASVVSIVVVVMGLRFEELFDSGIQVVDVVLMVLLVVQLQLGLADDRLQLAVVVVEGW